MDADVERRTMAITQIEHIKDSLHARLANSPDVRHPDIFDIKDDPINPSHYKFANFEAIEICEHFNFCLGNALKYILRAGKKHQSRKAEDLKKAIWYLQREIKNSEKGNDDEQKRICEGGCT